MEAPMRGTNKAKEMKRRASQRGGAQGAPGFAKAQNGNANCSGRSGKA